jgi:hypothetical protein
MKPKPQTKKTTMKVSIIPFTREEHDEVSAFLDSTGRVLNRYVRLAVLEKMARDKALEAKRRKA